MGHVAEEERGDLRDAGGAIGGELRGRGGGTKRKRVGKTGRTHPLEHLHDCRMEHGQLARVLHVEGWERLDDGEEEKDVLLLELEVELLVEALQGGGEGVYRRVGNDGLLGGDG